MLGLNDEAIAYGLIMMIVFIIGAGLVVTVLTMAMNGLTTETNDLIDEGVISPQTRHAVQFNLSAWWLWPVLVILGALFWYIVRPLEQKRLGG